MPALAGYDPNPSDNVRVEVAFATAPDAADPAWVDLTSRFDLTNPYNRTYGRADEYSAIQAGTASLTLDNSDGALTAANASSVFYPNVLPHRRIRVSYRAPGTIGNLLTAAAASFEDGSTGGWTTTIFGFTSPTISNSTTRAHGTGTHSLLIDWPAAGSSGAGFFPTLVDGRVYTVSAWVWVPTGSPAVSLGNPFGATPTDTSTTTDAWEQLAVTFTADVSASTYLAIQRAGAAGAGQKVWVDEIRVDEGTDATEFTTDPPPIQYRFTGFVEEWPVEWPNGGAYSQAQITAVDRLSRLGATRPMRSLIEEAVALYQPAAYWPLGEPEGATLAGDYSGATGVYALAITQYGAGGTLEFGTATGPPTDALPAPTFTPVSSSNGKYLSGSCAPIGSVDFAGATLRANFLTSTPADATVVRLVDPYGSLLELQVTSAGKLRGRHRNAFSGGMDTFTLTSATTVTDGSTHDAALVLSRSGGTVTVTLYLDGAVAGSTTYSSTSLEGFTRARVGGNTSGELLTGVVSHVAAYNTALTAAQVAEITEATTTGYEGDTSDERIARYARWAGITDAEMDLDAGSSTSICFTDTTGQSVLQAMQDVAQTEGGRLFIDGAGQLVFHSRSRTYDNPAASASVDAALLGEDVRFSMSTQGLVNDMTGKRPTGPEVRAFDADSIETYGVSSQTATLLVTSDTEVADAINWRVQGGKDPQVRMPQGRFDLYTDTTGYQAQLRALELGDRVTVTGLPAQAPASTVDLVVEGYTETIALTGWDLTANLSNFSTVQALVLDDDVHGLLDSDNRLIY